MTDDELREHLRTARTVREVEPHIQKGIHFLGDGAACHHIIDPITGMSVVCRHGWRYVWRKLERGK